MIRDAIKSLFTKGSFTQNVFIVSGGKVLVTIIGFVFIPILSRIYNPEAYGNFSIYYAIVTLLVTLFTLSYPSAFVIAKNEKTFYNLIVVSLISLFSFTTITFFAFIFFGQEINNSLIIFENPYYLLLIPVGILLNGCIELFAPWIIRRKLFIFSSTIGVGHNFLIRVFNLIIGIFASNISYGLIIGNQAGRLLAVFSYFSRYYFKERKSFLKDISIRNMIRTAKEYRNYPFYFLPSKLVNNLRNQAAIYFIGLGFGKSALGNFSIAASVLNIPIQIFSNSMSTVFIKKANDIYVSNKENLPLFILELLTRLFLIAVVPFAILSVYGEDLITLFLGDQWILAGKMSALMGPYFFTLLIISPVISILQVLKKERQLFLFNFTGLLLNVLALLSGLLLKNIDLLILLYTVSNVVLYLIQCFYIFKINNLPFWRIYIGFFLIYPLIVIILKAIKMIVML
jgi:O-antigen/teichoic acid export membrane protein